MKPLEIQDEWTIYNCHIHTFSQRHSPRRFWKWVLSDPGLGRFHWGKAILYVTAAVLYIFILRALAVTTLSISGRADAPSLLLYSFSLFWQAVMLIPILAIVLLILILVIIWGMQKLIDLLLYLRDRITSSRADNQLTDMKNAVSQGRAGLIRSSLLVSVLLWIDPAANDIFERVARFLKIAELPTQREVFQNVERQYPEGTVFVVLPMDMGFMDMGSLPASIDSQHAELLELAKVHAGRIIPFYAADPRHPDIVERVKANLGRGRFQGVKIYPNLGYSPQHEKLMEIYRFCIQGDFPVLTHCSPGGIWRYGVSKAQRRTNSEPGRYREILDKEEYRALKLCLAHFGGAEEWAKQLQGRVHKLDDEPWVRTIYEMIASGKYPNLYTDISYTVFTPRVKGLYIDLVDYLKVLLNHPRVRQRVLFGSDYYMVERESISEKEVSLLLRSRLGEDLYKQIAHTNPREFLGIGASEPAQALKKKRAPRKVA
jgi:predicted TIM-barrel fold metal-dependent hydrolase